MNICIELLWKALALLATYCIKNFIFVIFLLAILGFIKRTLGSALRMGVLAFGINVAIDFLVVGTGGLTTPITILGGVAIGILWALMTFTSEIPLLVRIPNAILVFIFGLLWGWAPIPFPLPLAPAVGYILQNYKTPNYLIGIVSLGITFLAFTIQIPILIGFCQGLNLIVNLF